MYYLVADIIDTLVCPEISSSFFQPASWLALWVGLLVSEWCVFSARGDYQKKF